MLLAVDVGNTNIVVGVIKDDEILFIERISTNRLKTELEYAIDIRTICDIHHIDRSTIDGAIVSSVVPQITGVMELAVEKSLHIKPIRVNAGMETGIQILLDNPKELGTDRIADAVAAVNEYPTPLIIIDMGTANTVSVINKKKQFMGGLIMPGVNVSIDALASRASQLNGITIEDAEDLIGKNTRDCMKSGAIFGNAAMVDGLIDRIEEELGTKTTVIATGGLSRLIIPHCKREIIRDENLLLKGLGILYNMSIEESESKKTKKK